MTTTDFRKTIRSNSFAARLTAEQRDELFELLAEGLSYREGAEKVRDWIMANDEAGLNGTQPARELRLTEATTIRRWYHATSVERRYALARETFMASQAHHPENYKTQTWAALDQARYLAVHENLRVTDIAMLERNELNRQKLAFQREKYDIESMFEHIYELQRLAKEGDTGPDHQRLVDNAIEHLERLRKTRDYQS